MHPLAELGKKRTVLLSVSVVLISLHTIYFYQIHQADIDPKKLLQQGVRFVLTIALMYFVYQGKKWARIIAVVLFAIAVLGVLIALVVLPAAFVYKVPLLVMAVIYSMAAYHFAFSKSYQAFYNYQNGWRG